MRLIKEISDYYIKFFSSQLMNYHVFLRDEKNMLITVKHKIKSQGKKYK